MSEFSLLRDEKYRNLNTSADVQSLYYKVIRDSSTGPFIDSDLSELIFYYCFERYNPSNQEIEERINDAIRYFGKGNFDVIYKLVNERLSK